MSSCDALKHPVLPKLLIDAEKAGYIETVSQPFSLFRISSGVTIYAMFIHTNTNFQFCKL